MHHVPLMKIRQPQQTTTHHLPQLLLLQSIPILQIRSHRPTVTILHHNLQALPNSQSPHPQLALSAYNTEIPHNVPRLAFSQQSPLTLDIRIAHRHLHFLDRHQITGRLVQCDEHLSESTTSKPLKPKPTLLPASS